MKSLPTLGACWQLLAHLTFMSCEDTTQKWLIYIWVCKGGSLSLHFGYNTLKPLMMSLLLQKLILTSVWEEYSRLAWGYPRRHNSSRLRKLAAILPILKWLFPSSCILMMYHVLCLHLKCWISFTFIFLAGFLCTDAVNSTVHSNSVVQSPSSP